ncbi:ribosomal-protein-alanine N-acetyltransferase [Deinobacterium chartae]|uniref:Ribosomal-protein-alanine N-acetyltransferase n=1 Tax=Deinobacterium chartae TaxID=521158 RepID=A0A841I0C4_9DEIO|nr:GNAT family N-acetyltransferase [Deinobacterium chartae]MBB6097572.1 ribosomal-protein-alanine N-acetyltransferase [Deinobacterium chartae]
MPLLSTAHLEIVPFTAELMRAAVHDRGEFARLLDARVPDSWPESDYAQVLPFLLEEALQQDGQQPWSALLIERHERQLVGNAGCRGVQGTGGTVEIGFSIVPEARNRGYATEATRGLIEWALAQPGVKRVMAECRADNAASKRVLEKAGMHCVHRVGDLMLWEWPPEPGTARESQS